MLDDPTRHCYGDPMESDEIQWNETPTSPRCDRTGGHSCQELLSNVKNCYQTRQTMIQSAIRSAFKMPTLPILLSAKKDREGAIAKLRSSQFSTQY